MSKLACLSPARARTSARSRLSCLGLIGGIGLLSLMHLSIAADLHAVVPQSIPGAAAKTAGGTGQGAPATRSGILHVIHTDDFAHHTGHLFHFLEDPATHAMTALHFPDGAPAHLRHGMRVTVRGGLQENNLTVAASAGSPTANVTVTAAPVASSATGEQKTLVMVANFRDAGVGTTVQAVDDLMFSSPTKQSVDGLYRRASSDRLWFTGTVLGPFLLNVASTDYCNYFAWGTALDAQAQLQGVQLSAYARKVYVLPSKNTCGFAGAGTIGGNPSQAWIMSSTTKDDYAHELGHNLTLQHASTTGNEYGDLSDVMGYSGLPLRLFNAPHQEALGFLATGGAVSVTQSGTYQLAPLEVPAAQATAPQILKIPKPNTADYYYVSYRQALSYDATLSATYSGKVNVHQYKGGGAKTYFLQSLQDAGSYQDAANGLTITQVQHTADLATVQVSMSCTMRAAKLPALAMQSARPGMPMSFALTVTTGDTLGCPPATLNLTAAAPTGWTTSLSPSSVTLDPTQLGANVMLTVTPPLNATSGNYALTALATDPLQVAHNASLPLSANVDVVAPTAPKSLTGFTSTLGVKLYWTAATDATGIAGYNVWRSGLALGRATTADFLDSTATPGLTYSYYVVAADLAANLSPASNTVTVKR